MTTAVHDAVVAHIARHRFPFHDQTDWPADYVTLTNAERRTRSIPVGGDEHFPDIVIVNTKGEVREIGEVEERLDEARVPIWQACSRAADDLTETGARHFFLYVPAGLEATAVGLLDRHAISFAGVRGYAIGAGGDIAVVPHETRGDRKDHHTTLREAADRNFQNLLIEDACASGDAYAHAAAIHMVTVEDGIFGVVASADAVVAALRGASGMEETIRR